MLNTRSPRPRGPRLVAAMTVLLLGAGCQDATTEDRDPVVTPAPDDEDTDGEDTGDDSSDEPRPEPGAEPELALPRDPAFTEPIELHGSGDDRVAVDIPGDDPAILHLTHDGSTYARVSSVDSDGQRIQRIVRERGTYEGARPLNFDGPPVSALDISADGDWSIVIRPLTDARQARGRIEGAGDEVVLLADHDAAALEATHHGRSRFNVRTWGHLRLGMVGAVGDYEGRVELHPEVVAIEVVADGDWTLDFVTASSDTG